MIMWQKLLLGNIADGFLRQKLLGHIRICIFRILLNCYGFDKMEEISR